MTRYFRDANFHEAKSFPVCLRGLQRRAGADRQYAQRSRQARPRADKWFNNVEIVTAEKIGIEPTTYVRNIFKYYTAYKLMLDLEETQKRRARIK